VEEEEKEEVDVEAIPEKPLGVSDPVGAADEVDPSTSTNEACPDAADADSADEQVAAEALAVAETHLRSLELDAADEVLSAALERLGARAAKELRGSEVARDVRRRLGQYDASCQMLLADGFDVVWEKGGSKLELKMDASRKWFDYRLMVEVDQSLGAVMAQNEEMDLAHKIQPLSRPIEVLGTSSPWLKQRYTVNFKVAVFNVELSQECFRYRGSDEGFLLESIESNADRVQRGAGAKQDSWRIVRPWIVMTNLWRPHADGGTTLTSVVRVDVGMVVPHWVVNVALLSMAENFVSDVRKAAALAARTGSPWAERMQADRDGFYREMRRLQEVRAAAVGPWDHGALQRQWKLDPEAYDLSPPSSRAKKP